MTDLSGIETKTTGDVMEVVVAPNPVAELLKPAEKRSSPSKYRSIELSPAFVQDPNRDEHPTTTIGKVLHRACETGDDRGLDEYQLRLVNMCREFVNGLLPPGASRFTEMRFPIVGKDYGYGDLVALKGNKGWYVDYKFGFNKQEDVEINPAAQAYVLGMFTTFPYLTEVEVVYLYPRLEEVSQFTFRKTDVPKIVARITAIKERHTRATPETCRAHEDTCVYCVHLGTCPVAGKALLPVAQKYAETHGLDVPVVPDLSQIRDPVVWGKIYKGLPAIEAFVDSAKRHALEYRQQSGNEIPGTTLREKRGARAILSPVEAWDVVKETITQDRFLNCCKISVPDLMEAVRETAPKGKKQALEQKVEQDLANAGILTQGESSWYLARAK